MAHDACMAKGDVGDHIDDWEGLDSHFLEQHKTRDGFSFLFLSAAGHPTNLYWWACGGCWTYSDPTDDVQELKGHAALHLSLCAVTRP